MFEIKNLEAIKHGKKLFTNFSLQIQPGEVVALYCESELRTIIMNMFISPKRIKQNSVIIDGTDARRQPRNFMKSTCFFSYTDGGYDRLTVLEHARFYKRLYGSSMSIEEVLGHVKLESLQHKKFGHLTYSEQRSVHFARVLFQDASTFIFEEPDIHIDIETKRLFMQLLETLQEKDAYVLILTSNLQHAIASGDVVYELHTQGCKKVQLEPDEKTDDTAPDKPFQFDKIPTKVDDKILLFDPFHIEYIESIDGQAFLHVHGESFLTTFTLQHL